MPLENQGGSGTKGSHWDKYFAASELLGPNDYADTVYSGLIMAFMEDTGWYKVSPAQEELMFFGKGAGSGIESGTCGSHPQSCTSSGPICSLNYNAKGVCGLDDYTDDCKIFLATGTEDCRFASNKPKTGDYLDKMTYSAEGRCIEGVLGSASASQTS